MTFMLSYDFHHLFNRNVSHNTDETDFDADNIKPSDSVSQVSSKRDLSVVSSKTVMIRRIEIERKKSELEHIEKLTRARKTRMRAEAEAEAEARVKAAKAEAAEAKAEVEAAEARKAQKLSEARAEAEEIEALSKFRMEAINLKAKEQLVGCSKRGSSVALSMVKSLFRSRTGSQTSVYSKKNKSKSLEKKKLSTVRSGKVSCSPVTTVPPGFEPGCSPSAETKLFVLSKLSDAATRYSVTDVI